MRYKLDDLGWYQFEQLIQSLLKAELGSGVESWGGHSDLGRDAYCVGTLRFPGRDVETAGPFIFQAKFVQNANAVGSNPAPALTAAAQKEVRRIRDRPDWQDPRHYVLITNVSLSPGLRAALTERLGAALPGAAIHLLGGEDICGMLDLHPALRRSFPQLLGIADLWGLISEAVSADVLAPAKRLSPSPAILRPSSSQRPHTTRRCAPSWKNTSLCLTARPRWGRRRSHG